MSAVERIKEIQDKRASGVVLEQRTRVIETEKANTKLAERNRFVANQTEIIIKESGVLQELEQICIELLEPDHAIKDKSLDYTPEAGLVSLSWGEFSGSGDSHYIYYIQTVVDVDRGILTIKGAQSFTFDRNTWKNKENIESAIASAYLQPMSDIEYGGS